MGIIEDIQSDLVSGNTPVGNVLLKLRLLAAKLGSEDLETWIKYEAEGYPTGRDVPDYRVLAVAFSGTFHGPFGSGVQNAPIPPLLVKQFAGEKWMTHTLRYSAAAVDALARDEDGVHLDFSNLMLVLRGKVYPEYEPAQIKGYISQSSIVEVANAIRNRLLEITIEIERRIPGASQVSLASIERKPEIATQILHQTVYGDVNAISNSGAGATLSVRVEKGNFRSLENSLTNGGLEKPDAAALAQIISEEKPDKPEVTPLGAKARRWLSKKLDDAVDGALKGGITATVKLAEEAALRYYGFK